jgi:type II secretory pathway pseudopilin PulG
MKLHFKKAFTVVEALVAIAILLVVITAAFSMAQASLQSSIYAKQRITAYYLAQEAIEYIRNFRDNNGLQALFDRQAEIHWLTGYGNWDNNDPCSLDSTTHECRIDVMDMLYGGQAPAQCGGGCGEMFVDLDTGLMQYTITNEGAISSGYSREIKLSSVQGNPYEVLVTVNIYWNQGSVPKSLTVQDTITNWQDPNL